MNQCTQTQQLSRTSEKVTKKLESILGCDVITTDFPSNNTMEFYVFMSSNELPSIIDYRIVIVNLMEHITDIDVYVNYLIACIYSKVFVQGNVNSMSTVVYKTSITNGYESLHTIFSTADDMSYQNCKDLFYINEDISIKASLEDGTLIIKDRGYGTTLIDLNRSLYFVREVA